MICLYLLQIFSIYLKVTLTKRYLITSRREQIPNIMTVEGSKYELVYTTEIGYLFMLKINQIMKRNTID